MGDSRRGSSGLRRGLSPEEVSARAIRQAIQPWRITPTNHQPSLFLSDATTARNLDRLRELGITHVVNAAAGQSCPNADVDYESASIRVMRLNAEDEEGYPMLERHLEPTQSFIAQAALENKDARILVHCRAGVNRSGLLVAAVAMLMTRTPVIRVVEQIRATRGNFFLMNESFQAQLVALARREALLGDSPADGRTPTSLVREPPRQLASFLSTLS